MTFARKLLPVIALAAVAVAPAARAEQADLTKVDAVTCTPDRIARCKQDGTCQWRDATARNKQELLVIDFKAKTASFRYKEQNRGGGVILDDKTEGDARRFVISKDKSRNPRTTMELSLDKAGKLTGTRNAGRVKFEGTCKAS